MRVLLFSGKGGAGKTTISSATALHAASHGHRVLIVSTDLAHSLADLLEGPCAQSKWQVERNVLAMEVDVLSELSRLWSELKDYLAELLTYFGFSTLMAEEAMLLPGVAEFFVLSAVLDAAESNEVDLVAVDCGPTADTMRMLGFADSAPDRIRKFLKLQKSVVAMLRPFRKSVEVPLPSESALDQLGPLADRADRIRRLITDRQTTSVRLVVNPDSLSIAETRRLYTYLNLFGMNIDFVVANKFAPDEWRNFLPDMLDQHLGYFSEIESSFPLETAKVFQRHAEIKGKDKLKDIGLQVYGERDPAEIFKSPPPMEYDRDETGRPLLRLPLSVADKSQLAVRQQGPHLLIKAGAFVRMIALPDSLTNAAIANARLDQGTLLIRFDNKG